MPLFLSVCIATLLVAFPHTSLCFVSHYSLILTNKRIVDEIVTVLISTNTERGNDEEDSGENLGKMKSFVNPSFRLFQLLQLTVVVENIYSHKCTYVGGLPSLLMK